LDTGNDPDDVGVVHESTADPSPATPVTDSGADGGNTGAGPGPGVGAETVTGTTTLAYPVAEKVTFDVPAETPATVNDALPPEEMAVDVTVATPGVADIALTDVPFGIARAALEIVTVPVAPTATDDNDGEASSEDPVVTRVRVPGDPKPVV
jgi:hypothetical protein